MAHRQWTEAGSLSNKAKNEAYINYQRKYEQMTKQQQLIEQKKQEIFKKQEEKKKKETEEALKKLNEDKLRSSESSRSKRGYHGYSKKSGRDRPEVPVPVTSLPSNIFTNDGSFFEQFQKISGVRVDVRKRSSKQATEPNNGDVGSESTAVEEKDEDKKNIDSTLSTTMSSPQNQQVVQPQQQQQQVQQHQMIHPQMQHQMQHPQMQQLMQLPPHMQQPPQMHPPRFTPQHMHGPTSGPPGCPPPMGMNYPPQFNPMMLPPPLTPSSIPPPAPLNPGSIPSPSPLQPCTIPSPSPLQPYAIPPPSPLIPHSIPPPSPMVPHSIPPPSPLMPHSIPPPSPIRPQSIPPPVQRPPLFLSMVACPPPPPPPEEDVSKPEPAMDLQNSASVTESIPEPEPEPEPLNDANKEYKLAKTAKELFDRNDYSSSSSSSENEKDDKAKRFGPPNRRNSSSSDSDSVPGRRSPETDSDKESDGESYHKEDVRSEMDSTMEQESQPMPETESEADSVKLALCAPVVIEDTQTQFPSDTKDSSNAGDPAPPDLCSEGEAEREADSQPPRRFDSDHQTTEDDSQHCSLFVPHEVKEEPKDIKETSCDIKPEDVKLEETTSGGTEVKVEVQEEAKPVADIKPMIKMQFVPETKMEDTGVKVEEPPVKKKRRSRWATEDEKVEIPSIGLPPASVTQLPPVRPPGVGPVGMVAPTVLGTVNTIVPPLPPSVPTINVPGMSGALISKVNRTDPALVAYAMKSFGRTNLTDAEWKKAEDHYKINLLYQDMMRKREELERLQAAGRKKYEYDSDEDCDGGTWEHKLRSAEMEATQLWADELTEAAKGKHHIGDFLPPDELARFMEKYEALKEGREPDLSDYKEFKLKEDNIGFQMLQKLGWTEGQGLGVDGSGIVDPVNKSTMRPENQGLGMERPDDVDGEDDEYDAYRKRMMLAYRFRPNPMNNPRRPYY